MMILYGILMVTLIKEVKIDFLGALVQAYVDDMVPIVKPIINMDVMNFIIWRGEK